MSFSSVTSNYCMLPCLQEARGPLLAVPNRVDGSLADQIEAMKTVAPKDEDLAAAQSKVP